MLLRKYHVLSGIVTVYQAGTPGAWVLSRFEDRGQPPFLNELDPGNVGPVGMFGPSAASDAAVTGARGCERRPPARYADPRRRRLLFLLRRLLLLLLHGGGSRRPAAIAVAVVVAVVVVAPAAPAASPSPSSARWRRR